MTEFEDVATEIKESSEGMVTVSIAATCTLNENDSGRTRSTLSKHFFFDENHWEANYDRIEEATLCYTEIVLRSN